MVLLAVKKSVDILKWAQEQHDKGINSEVFNDFDLSNPEWIMNQLSGQLHASLTAACKNDALIFVQNSVKGPRMGLDA